jgi:hypothetical protein
LPEGSTKDDASGTRHAKMTPQHCKSLIPRSYPLDLMPMPLIILMRRSNGVNSILRTTARRLTPARRTSRSDRRRTLITKKTAEKRRLVSSPCFPEQQPCAALLVAQCDHPVECKPLQNDKWAAGELIADRSFDFVWLNISLIDIFLSFW